MFAWLVSKEAVLNQEFKTDRSIQTPCQRSPALQIKSAALLKYVILLPLGSFSPYYENYKPQQ